jgi:4'-phosphopantetheinyl transferase
LGVDVEQERPALNWQPIARRLLSSQQVDALLQQPVAEQARAFLQAWCHLEAELKAGGWGLAAPPVGGSAGLMGNWRLCLGRGYVGALAAGQASDPSLNG